MSDVPTPTPSTARLLQRLVVPTVQRGLESVALEAASPGADAAQRLEAAQRLLKRLSSETPDVDEAVIDRMIEDAEEALRKLEDEGEQAVLSDSEAFGLEAVIESDGSRPVLFVQDGTIDLEDADLNESLAQRWRLAAETFLPGIRKVAASVGAVQLPAFGNRRIGTAFLIKPGFVVTNRHVLEEVAVFQGGAWQWRYAAEVDFIGEYQRTNASRFPLEEVVFWGPNSISRSVNFANLDLVVIRLGGDAAKLPPPLPLEGRVDAVSVTADIKPSIYVIGFPAKPRVIAGNGGDVAPAAGHEYQVVLEKLYGSLSAFGSKRWAPGFIEAGAGQLVGDVRGWVMSHDASTLGGNSGSCVVDFDHDGGRVLGLHFGGRPRVENYAHIVAALRESLAAVDGITWV